MDFEVSRMHESFGGTLKAKACRVDAGSPSIDVVNAWIIFGPGFLPRAETCT